MDGTVACVPVVIDDGPGTHIGLPLTLKGGDADPWTMADVAALLLSWINPTAGGEIRGGGK